MTALDVVLGYASLGWRAFPIAGGDKRPAFGSSWVETATVEPDRLRTWWRPGSRLNVGVVTGELFDVFDLEAEHLQRFRHYMADRWLPETPLARTGGGGIHILVRPSPIKANRRLFIDGIHVGELKSRRGYIVVAPSVTASTPTHRGGPYGWLWPAETPLAAAPDWLIDIVGKPAAPVRSMPWRQISIAPRRDLEPLVRLVRHSRPPTAGHSGNRNETLHWAANRAADDGVPMALAMELLLEAFIATTAAGENLADRIREGKATIVSAFRR
jgi:hypothetical protein